MMIRGKYLFLGIDELTLVISADKTSIETLEDWVPKAEEIITEFARLANLEEIFGTQKPLDGKCPQGYSVGYQYGDNPFYFAVAYHPFNVQMGVVVKFSAYSWFAYCDNRKRNIVQFLNDIKSELYSFRLSRVDFTADYWNYRTTVSDLYHGLINDDLEIQDYKGRRNISKITAVEVDGAAGSFYVGSRKTGSRLFLRVYDKKMEQVENNGFLLKHALDVVSWIRFEAVFKGCYAHQLTDMIMDIEKKDLTSLIANKIAEKYRFYNKNTGKNTDFTTALLNQSKALFHPLSLDSPRDNDLLGSLQHIVNGSGLYPVLYKCDKIWGKGTSTFLLNRLHDIYKRTYKPNDDVRLWLKKHKKALKNQSIEDTLKIFKALNDSRIEDDLLFQEYQLLENESNQ